MLVTPGPRNLIRGLIRVLGLAHGALATEGAALCFATCVQQERCGQSGYGIGVRILPRNGSGRGALGAGGAQGLGCRRGLGCPGEPWPFFFSPFFDLARCLKHYGSAGFPVVALHSGKAEATPCLRSHALPTRFYASAVSAGGNKKSQKEPIALRRVGTCGWQESSAYAAHVSPSHQFPSCIA